MPAQAPADEDGIGYADRPGEAGEHGRVSRQRVVRLVPGRRRLPVAGQVQGKTVEPLAEAARQHREPGLRRRRVAVHEDDRAFVPARLATGALQVSNLLPGDLDA